jgi:hypothetical protein
MLSQESTVADNLGTYMNKPRPAQEAIDYAFSILGNVAQDPAAPSRALCTINCGVRSTFAPNRIGRSELLTPPVSTSPAGGKPRFAGTELQWNRFFVEHSCVDKKFPGYIPRELSVPANERHFAEQSLNITTNYMLLTICLPRNVTVSPGFI